MAQALSFTAQKGAQAFRPAAVFLTVATGGGVYATPTGVAVDLTTILATATQKGLSATDIIAIYGRTNDGYTAQFTFSAGNIWNMRLWTSGGTEIGDGAITKTVEAIIWFAGGALN